MSLQTLALCDRYERSTLKTGFKALLGMNIAHCPQLWTRCRGGELGPSPTVWKNMDIPLVRARSWDHLEYVDWDWCTGVVPNGGMLGRNFLVGFSWISMVSWSYWLLRGRSRICPLGLFCGLFSIFEVRNWQFSRVSQILVCRFGGCLWGYGIGSGPFFMGDIDLRVRAWTCPLCVHWSFA